MVLQLVHEGDPQSKARPRLGRSGHTYTPKATAAAEEELRWRLRTTLTQGPLASCTFGVYVAFYTQTRRRRDLDNMVKLVLDACNGFVWEDDSQVNEVLARVERGTDRPRTELVVYRTHEMSTVA